MPFAEFSLTLWCQNKNSSILNDMAKVAIKYDNIVPLRRNFYAMNEFDIPNGGKGTLYAHIS